MTRETYLWVVVPSLLSEDPEKSEIQKCQSVINTVCLHLSLAMNNIRWHRKMGESYQQAKMVFSELAKRVLHV